MWHHSDRSSNLEKLLTKALRSKNQKELQDNSKAIERYIDQNNSSDLLMRMQSNSTLVGQALYTPFVAHKNDKAFAEKISYKVVELLLIKMQQRLNEDDFQNKILNNKTTAGFMLLLQALSTGSMRMVDKILGELNKPGREAILENNLASCTKDGFSVLQQALISGSEVIVATILAELNKLGREAILENNLASCTKDGFSVLQQALISGSEVIVATILGELNKPGREAIMRENLANCTKDGFRVLQQAVISGSTQMVDKILGELNKPEREAILETNLANCTKSGFNVLQEAVKSGSTQMVDKILGELNKPGREAIMRENLANCTRDGFRLLQQAVMSGSTQMVDKILAELNKPGREAIMRENLANCTKDGFRMLQVAAKLGSTQMVEKILHELKKLGQEEILKANLMDLTRYDFTVLHTAGLTNNIEIFNLIVEAFHSTFGDKAPEVLHQLACLKNTLGYLPSSKIKAIEEKLQGFRDWVPERVDNSRKSVVNLDVETQIAAIEQTNKLNVRSKIEPKQSQMRVKDTITLTTVNDAQAVLGERWHNNLDKVCYIMLPTTNRPPYRDLKAIAKDLYNNLPSGVKCILMVGLNNQDNPQALMNDVAEFRAWHQDQLLPLEVHIDGFNWQVATKQDSNIKVPFGAIRNRILTSTLKHMNKKYPSKQVTKLLMTLDSDTIINRQSFKDLFNGTIALEAGSLGYLYDKSSLRSESKLTDSLVYLANVLDMRLRRKLGDLGYLAECSLFMKGAVVDDLQARVDTLEQGKDLPLFTAGGAESRGLIKYCKLMNFRYGAHFDEKNAPVISKIPSQDDIDWIALDGLAEKSEKQKYNAVNNILFNHPYSNANYRFFVNQLRFAMSLKSDSCKELSEIASSFYIPNLIAANNNKNFAQLSEALFAMLNNNKAMLLSKTPCSMTEEQYRKVVCACYDWGHEVATFIRDEMGKLPEIREAIKYGQGTKIEQNPSETVQSNHFGTRNMYYGNSKILADEILTRGKRMLPQDSNPKRQRIVETHEDAGTIIPKAVNESPAARQHSHQPGHSVQAPNAITVNTPLLYSAASKRSSSQAQEAAKRVKRSRSQEPQNQKQKVSISMTGIAEACAENSADEDMMNDAFADYFKQSKPVRPAIYDNPFETGPSRRDKRTEQKARVNKILHDLEEKRAKRALQDEQRKLINGI